MVWSKARLCNVKDVFVFSKHCQQVYCTYISSYRNDRSRVDWLSILKTKSKGRVEVVQDENDYSNIRDDVFQVNELVEPYRVSTSIDMEENLNFCVFNNIFIDVDVDVDVEELNVVLSSSGQAQIDEDDDINVEDCVGADNESIEEEEDNSD
jgi:hypothetical protein